MVGEFEARSGFAPSGHREPTGRAGRFRPAPTLMRLPLPSKRSPDSVAAIRFAAPASPFRRPRGLSKSGRPAPEHRQLPGIGPSSGYTGSTLPAPRGTGRPSWGFSPLQRHQLRRSTSPGRPARFVPSPGFLTLLTACSLRRLPIPKDRCHSWGSTLQSLSPSQSRAPFGARSLPAVSDIAFSSSEDQEITMPRGFKVLLPARIRTPSRPGGRFGADTLLGFRPSRAGFSVDRGPGFPEPSSRFVEIRLGETDRASLEAWPKNG